MRKVVVTGVGAISPCGLDVESSWKSILAGQTGIAPITRFDATDYAVRFAGEVKGFEVTNFIEKKRVREGDTFIHYAIAAADEAVKSSGFEPNEEQREKVGTIIGVGLGGLPLIEEMARTLHEKGPRRVSPYFIPAVISNLAPGQLSMRFGKVAQNVEINTWFASQLAYFIDKLKEIPEGDGSVFDNTVILWTNEQSVGNNHDRTNMPYVLAGSAGGVLQTGQYITQSSNVGHQRLMVTIMNALGVVGDEFGNPEYGAGPLTGLT